MNASESIKEMFTRFNHIVTNLQALGKTIIIEEKIQKILGSLPSSWEPKVTAIEEVRDVGFLRSKRSGKLKFWINQTLWLS